MKKESIDDPRRRELGQFLRSRRRALNPDDLGLKPHTHRRDGGLSREQVAELVGISADWYGRLEGGTETMPSRATLLNIVNALRLTSVESAFVFELAGLTGPRGDERSDEAGVEVLDRLLADPSRVGICVLDVYVTPIRWNAIADALWRFSDLGTPIKRNFIVRLTDPYLVSLTGTEYESSVKQLVGMFRRAHTRIPTPFSEQVLELALREPIFCRFWHEHSVAEETWLSGGPYPRHHPIVGTLWIKTLNLSWPRAHDQIVAAVAPADEASAKKFDRLRAIGKASEIPP